MSNPLSMPSGVTGLPHYSGYVYDEWLPELQGPRGRRVIREMLDNSAIIGAIMFGTEMLVRQVGWRVEPDPSAAADDDRPEFVDTCFHDMAVTWEDTLGEILTFLPYGFSLHETLFKIRDGVNSKFTDNQIGWHSWPMRGQETLQRWDFDDYGQPTAMIQRGAPDWVEHTIPLEKALLFRTTTRKGTPEGRSIFRNAYQSYYYLKHLQTMEGIGVERNLAGLPIARVPSELLSIHATPEQQEMLDAIKEITFNVRVDEQAGVVIPSDVYPNTTVRMFDFELMKTGGESPVDVDAIIARYEQRILMTCMTDFMLLGHEATGSHALSQVKAQLFTAALGAYLAEIAAVINDVAIPRLLRLNGMNTDAPPRLVHGDIERPDLELLGTFLWRISQAGIALDTAPDGELVRHLMGQAHLPEPPEEPGPPQEPGSSDVNDEEEPERAPSDTGADDTTTAE